MSSKSDKLLSQHQQQQIHQQHLLPPLHSFTQAYAADAKSPYKTPIMHIDSDINNLNILSNNNNNLMNNQWKYESQHDTHQQRYHQQSNNNNNHSHNNNNNNSMVSILNNQNEMVTILSADQCRDDNKSSNSGGGDGCSGNKANCNGANVSQNQIGTPTQQAQSLLLLEQPPQPTSLHIQQLQHFQQRQSIKATTESGVWLFMSIFARFFCRCFYAFFYRGFFSIVDGSRIRYAILKIWTRAFSNSLPLPNSSLPQQMAPRSITSFFCMPATTLSTSGWYMAKEKLKDRV